jgi:hypothetical protein
MSHYAEGAEIELLARPARASTLDVDVILVADGGAHRNTYGPEECAQRGPDEFSRPLHMVYGSKP